jgi:hypothetical protein
MCTALKQRKANLTFANRGDAAWSGTEINPTSEGSGGKNQFAGKKETNTRYCGIPIGALNPRAAASSGNPTRSCKDSKVTAALS